MFSTVQPSEWLSDEGLTPQGEEARREYEAFCSYLQSTGLAGFQVARAKYHLYRQNYWSLPDGFALPPHTINVNVNNLCNLLCKHCDFGQREEETFYHRYNVIDRDHKIEMPLETCKAIVDQAQWFRPIIRASFREPMMYKHILPLIEYTRSKDLPFWLLTNGFNLARYAKDLAELGVESIRISLDGPEAVHDNIRQAPGVYRKIIDGVSILIEEKQRRRSNMQIGFYFTLSDYNATTMLEMLEELESEGILRHVFVNFQWLLYTTAEMAERHNKEHGPICGGYVDPSTILNIDLSAIDLEAASKQAQAIKQRFPAEDGYRIHFRPNFDLEHLTAYRDTVDFPVEEPRCRVPWYNMNINPAGDTKTFHHCLLPDVGNIHSTSLMDIWNGQPLRSQRQGLQEHGAYHGCARCWGVYSLLEDKKRS